MNIYREITTQALPRLLAFYNLDRMSTTCGFGDRLFWGWKTRDFVDGGMQGGVHALALALEMGLLPNEPFILDVIDAAVFAIDRIHARNGSLVEAYPGEGSFCVTALAAYDILSAVHYLKDRVSSAKTRSYLDTVYPLLGFLETNDEVHGVISNHLAAAAAAFALWNELTGERRECGNALLERILRFQSDEGWHREYEGADPGYQTLCTGYLARLYSITKNPRLLDSLARSGRFLKYAVHPDGTIGGLYGSRNTEVYYPAGLIWLAPIAEDVARMAGRLQQGIEAGRHITPLSVDAGNFVPLLNAYAEAAYAFESARDAISKANTGLPCDQNLEKDFPHAGLYVRSTPAYYAILNYKKGGALKVFDKQTGRIDSEDGGLFGTLGSGRRFSTQAFDDRIGFTDKTIQCGFYRVNETCPTPMTTIIVRVLGLTFFRATFLSNLFKKAVVRLLMTGKRRLRGGAIRRFTFTDHKIIVQETIVRPPDCEAIGHPGKCRAIHMASSGYGSLQDMETPERSRIVEFIAQ